MSAEEAEEVLRLWQERQSSSVQIDDLAEALAAPSGEIENLLAQVRAKNKITVQAVATPLFSWTGVAAIAGLVMCALIGAAIVELVVTPSWRQSNNFFYLFAALSLVYVPLSTFVLSRNRRRELDESKATKEFVLKVQRRRD